MSPVRQSTLAMILREAINNIIKHAHATKVEGNLINKQEKLYYVYRIMVKVCDNQKLFV